MCDYKRKFEICGNCIFDKVKREDTNCNSCKVLYEELNDISYFESKYSREFWISNIKSK